MTIRVSPVIVSTLKPGLVPGFFLVVTPSPRRGEGWGEGERSIKGQSLTRLANYVCSDTLSHKGRGEERERTCWRFYLGDFHARETAADLCRDARFSVR